MATTTRETPAALGPPTGTDTDTAADRWRSGEFFEWLRAGDVTADLDDDDLYDLFDGWVLSRSRLRTGLGLVRAERSLSAADVEFLVGEDAAQFAAEIALDVSTTVTLTARAWSYYLMFLAETGDPIPELKERLLTFLATWIGGERPRSGSTDGVPELPETDPRRELEDLGALPFVRSASAIVEMLTAGPLEGTAFEAGMVRQAMFATHLIETSGSLVRPGRLVRDWRSADLSRAAGARRALVVWWVHTIGLDLSDQEPDRWAEVHAELVAALQGKPSRAEPGTVVAAVLSHLGVVPGGVMPVGVRPAVQVGLNRLSAPGSFPP